MLQAMVWLFQGAGWGALWEAWGCYSWRGEGGVLMWPHGLQAFKGVCVCVSVYAYVCST